MPIEWRRAAGFASLALLAVLLVGARTAPGAEADRPAQAVAQLDDPALVESGRQRFNQACSYCHGKEGAGGKTKSFKSRHDLEASAVFDTIANGRKRGANIMPPWKSTLSETQIWELVAYILSLSNAPANE
jgi:cytochrome c oxidase cbb3-type subunit 3